MNAHDMGPDILAHGRYDTSDMTTKNKSEQDELNLQVSEAQVSRLIARVVSLEPNISTFG
jgi:hypothetical protein